MLYALLISAIIGLYGVVLHNLFAIRYEEAHLLAILFFLLALLAIAVLILSILLLLFKTLYKKITKREFYIISGIFFVIYFTVLIVLYSQDLQKLISNF